MKDCKPTYRGIRYDNVNQIIDVIKQENFGNPFDSRGESFSPRQLQEINYTLKAVNTLQSDKAKQVFSKGKKNNWDLSKILTELQIPKEQKQVLLDLDTTDREELALELASNYSFAIEVNTGKKQENTFTKKAYSDYTIDGTSYLNRNGKFYKGGQDAPVSTYVEISKDEFSKGTNIEDITVNPPAKNSDFYSNLTVPGGTNYTENEISTPLIKPSIKGHAQFSTDNGIGWFRSDEQILTDTYDLSKLPNTFQGYTTSANGLIYQGKVERINNEWFINDQKINNEQVLRLYSNKNSVKANTKTRRVLELQSDLFQKGRNKKALSSDVKSLEDKLDKTSLDNLVADYEDLPKYLSGKDLDDFNKLLKEAEEIDESTITDELEEDFEKRENVFREIAKQNYKNNALKEIGKSSQNDFLQLLNKKNNWVTFFTKSIIQDSAKKGYKKVLFPKGDTAAKIEGHQTLEGFKKEKKARISKLEYNLNILEKQFVKADENSPQTVEENVNKEEVLSNLHQEIKTHENEIRQLKKELADVESGQTQLSSIAKFYEETVTNILKKNNFNPKEITDEYGNKWNEISTEGYADRAIALSPRQENKPQKYELFPGVYANKQQEEAIDNLRLFLSDDKQQSISLVGRGGTGKTTIIKKIVEDSNKTPYFIAPTHKAKSVLSQSTGAPASTLASALMIDLDLNTGKFKPNLFKRKMRLRQGLGETPISDYSLIIIDEGSMMNDEMFNEVMKLKDPSAKVIMMGDNVQLPPVGQESDSKMFDLDKSKLTERMRQGEESPIVPLTDIIAENVESEKPEIRVIKDRENKFDKDSNQGVLFLKSEDAALKEFEKDYKNNPKSTKIITFNNQNNDSEQSVKNLNKKIRAKLQPDAPNHLVEGDQVMAYSSTMLDGTSMSEDNDVQNSSEYTVQNPGPVEERGVLIIARSKKLGARSERLVFEGQKVSLVDNITGDLLSEDHVIPTEKGKKQISDFKNKYAEKKDFQMLYKVDEKIPQMEFGYAINSHKAQGSTYRNVYVAEDNILSGSLRNAKVKNQSLYVAISRASDKVVIQSMKNPSDKIESTMELGDKPADSDIQNQNISPIDYSELGDKVENYNVKIDTAKGRKPTKDKNEIVAYRGPNTKRLNNEEGLIKDLEENRMVGNPFGPYGLTKMPSSEKGEATTAFYNWLAGTEYQDKYQDYRQAILDKKNKMKSLDILYYKDIGRPSHATALGYLLQQKDTPLPVGQKQKKPDLTPAEKYEKWLYGSIESQTDNEKAKREWIIDEVLEKDSELNQRIAKGQPIKGKGSHMPVLKQFIQDNSPLFTDRPKINDSMSMRQNITQEDINNLELDC